MTPTHANGQRPTDSTGEPQETDTRLRTDDLRDRAGRLRTIADLLEVVDEVAPDATADLEMMDACATLHLEIGTPPAAEDGDDTGDDHPYAPSYEATRPVKRSSHDGRTQFVLPAIVLEPLDADRVYIYPDSNSCRVAAGESDEFVEYKARPNPPTVQNSEVTEEWLDVVPGDRVHMTYLPDENEVRLEPERCADRDDEEETKSPSLENKQQKIVVALLEHGESSGPELQECTGQGSGIHKHLSELAEQGLINRRDDPDDGRRRLYSLTDDGQARVEESDEPEQWAALVNGGEQA